MMVMWFTLRPASHSPCPPTSPKNNRARRGDSANCQANINSFLWPSSHPPHSPLNGSSGAKLGNWIYHFQLIQKPNSYICSPPPPSPHHRIMATKGTVNWVNGFNWDRKRNAVAYEYNGHEEDIPEEKQGCNNRGRSRPKERSLFKLRNGSLGQ